MSKTTRGFSRLLLLALGALVLSGSLFPLGAVPVFSRKYQTSCQTCHTIFPKLNPFGQAFRLNGYRMPAERDRGGGQGEAGCPGRGGLQEDLAGRRLSERHPRPRADRHQHEVRRRLRLEPRRHRPLDLHNDFQFPQEVNLFTAGTLGEHLRLPRRAHLRRAAGRRQRRRDRARPAHFHQLPLRAPHLINFKLGKFSPDLVRRLPGDVDHDRQRHRRALRVRSDRPATAAPASPTRRTASPSRESQGDRDVRGGDPPALLHRWGW